jgi:hypothetical protein
MNPTPIPTIVPLPVSPNNIPIPIPTNIQPMQSPGGIEMRSNMIVRIMKS